MRCALQVGGSEQSLPLPNPGVFHRPAGPTADVPHIGDEIIRMIDDIAIVYWTLSHEKAIKQSRDISMRGDFVAIKSVSIRIEAEMLKKLGYVADNR